MVLCFLRVLFLVLSLLGSGWSKGWTMHGFTCMIPLSFVIFGLFGFGVRLVFAHVETYKYPPFAWLRYRLLCYKQGVHLGFAIARRVFSLWWWTTYTDHVSFCFVLC